MKRLLSIVASLLFAAPLLAQTTAVTATLQDTAGTAWANAKVLITWVGQGTPSTTSGQSFPLSIPATANSSGVFTATVTDVAYIVPANSTWQVCVTSAVSSPQTYCTNIPITGASENISVAINAVLVPPSLTGGPLTNAYADSELSAVNGNQYYRIGDGHFRCYSLGAWGDCSSNSGGPFVPLAGNVSLGSATGSAGPGTLNFQSAPLVNGVAITSGFANPMTTLGDVIYGGASGAATRLAGPTAGAGTYFLIDVPTTTSAVAETFSTAATGTGSPVLATSPTLVTPALGTPASGVITNLTGTCASCVANSATLDLPLAGGTLTGTLNGTSASFSGTVTSTNTGAGTLTLNGLTSGSATITAPAVAGTITNPFALSNAITAPGLWLEQSSAIGTAITPGAELQNTTASTSGATQQYSPCMELEGHGWNTGTPADNTVDWVLCDEPQSGNPPYGNLVFGEQVAGGGFNALITFNPFGSGNFSGTTVGGGQIIVGTAGATVGLIDKSVGMTTADMSGQTTTTPTTITGMTWNLSANKNYALDCQIAITYATAATVKFQFAGPGTATSFSLFADGGLGAAGVYSQLTPVLKATTWATATGASGAVAGTSIAHIHAGIQNGSTASGTALALQTVANGTNSITVLANSTCQIHQVN